MNVNTCGMLLEFKKADMVKISAMLDSISQAGFSTVDVMVEYDGKVRDYSFSDFLSRLGFDKDKP